MPRFPVTFALACLLAVCFAIQTAIDLTAEQSGPLRPSFEAWAVTNMPTEKPVRLITGTLLHAGLLHLGMNSWMLLQLGSVFELLFGSARLAVLYLVSAVSGALASSVFLEPGHVSVGASGAIFGVAGGLLVMMGAMRRRKPWASSLRVQLAVWAVATLIVAQVTPAIDNAAHIGGFVAGLITAALFRAYAAGLPRVRASRA